MAQHPLPERSPDQRRRTALVIGAGIAGLACANGLHRHGWSVTVLERMPAPEEVGAGITLWPNALRALDVVGLGAAVGALGAHQGAGGVRAADGRWLTRLDGAALQRALGRPPVVVHRAVLHRTLLDRLPAGVVRPGVEVGDVSPDGRVDAPGASGLPAADLVVAADGIASVARRQLWPRATAPVYTGLTAWRAVCSVAVRDVSTYWGSGTEFGALPLSDGRTYWYAATRAPERERADDEKAQLLERFARWHPPVPGLIAATAPDAILRNDLRRLRRPPRRLVRGRVVLVGDAAHAMTPNLGQGGCQALEDAAVLTIACAAGDENLSARLRWYERQRRARVRAVMRASYWAGRAGPYLASPAAVRARNALIGLAPPSAAVRQFVRVSGWRPPAPPGDALSR